MKKLHTIATTMGLATIKRKNGKLTPIVHDGSWRFAMGLEEANMIIADGFMKNDDNS